MTQRAPLMYYVLFTCSVLLWVVWLGAMVRLDATRAIAVLAMLYCLRSEMTKVRA